MKKQLLSMSGVVFLCIFGACLLNLAVMEIALKIVNLFVEVDFFGAVIVRLVTSLIVVAGIPAAVSYLVAYKMSSFDMGNAIASFCLASLPQLLVSILLKFQPFIGGGSFYLAGLFESGSGFDSASEIEYIGIIDYLLAFLVCFILGLGLYVLAGKIGAVKRLRDREELLSAKTNG